MTQDTRTPGSTLIVYALVAAAALYGSYTLVTQHGSNLAQKIGGLIGKSTGGDDKAAADEGVALGGSSTAMPEQLISKSQRMARASSLVSGMGKQGQVTEVFTAADGSTGVVIKSGEGHFIGWMLPGIDALFVGAKFDRQGRNITQEEMIARRFATPTDAGTAAGAGQAAAPGAAGGETIGKGLLEAVAKSPGGFIEGTGGPLITAYIDANCAYCNQLWRNLRNHIGAGQVRVRWVPVAVIAPSSMTKAATIMQSADPLQVLTEHGVTGAPVRESRPTDATTQRIEANNAMLRALALVAQHRRFKKPMRYDGDEATFPDFVLTDGPDEVPMEIYGFSSPEYDRRKQAKIAMYEQSKSPFWQWDLKTDKVPPPFPLIPPRPRAPGGRTA